MVWFRQRTLNTYDTKLIRYQIYQILNRSDIEPIRYWTYQIPSLSDSEHICCQTFLMLNLLETEQCLPPRSNLYCQPLPAWPVVTLGTTVHPSPLSPPSLRWPPTPTSATFTTSAPPKPQWPPTLPAWPVVKLGTKWSTPVPSPLSLVNTLSVWLWWFCLGLACAPLSKRKEEVLYPISSVSVKCSI